MNRPVDDDKKKKIASNIEDILLLYAADSIAAMESSIDDNINWSGTAEKAAYKLGRRLEFLYSELEFGIPALDKAMQEGYRDSLEEFQKVESSSHSPVNICYIA